MKLVILGFGLLLCLTSFAKEKHREHGAHVHGAGTLGIAFDEAKGTLEFKIPSESIFGFEYTPTKEKDKKAMKDGLEKLETKISEMVVFDSSLNCLITKEKLEVVKEKHDGEDADHDKKQDEHHGGHSETVAIFLVKCDKSPVGTRIVFNFQKFFPRIKDLDIQVLAGAVQKSVEAKKNGASVEVK